MCIEMTFPSDLRITDKDLEAYKIISMNDTSIRQSDYFPTHREPQTGYITSGTLFVYSKGAILESPIPKTPGIYLFPSKEDAFRYINYIHNNPRNLIKVLIPKGETVYTGRIPSCHHGDQIIKTINASKVQVLD